MNRTQKFVIAIITYLPTLVLTAFCVFYVAHQVNLLTKHSNVILMQQISSQLGKDVRIGKARITSLGDAVFEDVAIANGKTFASGKLLEAKKVVVSYNWRAMLFKNMGAQSINYVKLYSPKLLLVRKKDGKFNVQELLKHPPGAARPPFKGKVSIFNASITFTDNLAHTLILPAINRINNVTAEFDASDMPKYAFNIKAHNGGGRFGKAEAIGYYNSKSKLMKLDMNIRDASAPYWMSYLGLLKSIKVNSGRMNVVGGISWQFKKQGKKVFDGVFTVNNAAANVPSLHKPASDINGTIIYSNDTVAMSLKGIFAKSPIVLRGVVTNIKHPQLNLDIKSPQADLAEVAKAANISYSNRFSIRGKNAVAVRVTGSASDPLIAVNTIVPQVVLGGYTAQNLKIYALYKRRQVGIEYADFYLMGAPFSAQGTITLGNTPRLAINGRADNIRLSSIPMSSKLSVSGIASAVFSVSGTASNPNVMFEANVSSGSVRGLKFGSASAQFRYLDGHLSIPSFELANIAGGTVRAAGSASVKKLKLEISAENVDIRELANAFGQKGYSGVGFFRGNISGTPEDPVLSGVAEAFRARVKTYDIDYAKIDMTARRSGVNIKDSVIRVLPGDLALSAKLSFTNNGDIGFIANASLERLRVEQLFSMAGDSETDVRGTIKGKINVSGVYSVKNKEGSLPFTGLKASGSLSVDDGNVYGYSIETADANFNIKNDLLTVENAVVNSENASFNFSGAGDLNTKALDVKFALNGFDLARLGGHVGKYVTLGGIAGASGTLSGYTDNMKLALNAGIDKLSVNGEKFDNAQLDALYENDVVSTFQASVKRGTQSLTVSGKDYDPVTNNVDSITGHAGNISVADLWNVLTSSRYFAGSEQGVKFRNAIQNFPRLTNGFLDATFSVHGNLAKPDGNLTLIARKVGIDISQIDMITADVASTNGVIKLNELKAVSGDMNVTATGDPVYEDGKIHLSLSASNIDLSRLHPWLGANTPGGLLAADVLVDGDVHAPRVLASMEVANPSFKGISFDRFRASRLEIVNDRINISDVILAVGKNQVVAQGHLPWNWKSLSVPKGEPLDITAKLNKQDLSILGTFAPIINSSNTHGDLEAALSIGGTLSAPQLNGSMKISNGTVALKGFTNTFTPINADVVFDGDKMVFNKFSVGSSQGGSLSVVPGGSIAVGDLQSGLMNLQVIADRMIIGEHNVLGMQEDVSMQVDAGLSVGGMLSSPLVADAAIGGKRGGILVSNAKVAFVAPDQNSTRIPLLFPVNPRFKVSMNLGDNVRVTPPSMSLLVKGGGSLGGSLNEPDLGFNLTVDEGNIKLATSRLQVTPGGKITVRYAPPANPQLNVNFQATTYVTAINQLNRQDRYQIIMTVSGPVNDLHIDLASKPADLTREEILASLGHVEGIFTKSDVELQKELGNVLTAVGTSTIFAPIETLFVEKFGFEQFTLEYSSISPLAIYFSRRLFGDVYVSFYQRLTSNLASVQSTEYQASISYRYKKVYDFSFSIDDQQTSAFEIGTTRSFY